MKYKDIKVGMRVKSIRGDRSDGLIGVVVDTNFDDHQNILVDFGAQFKGHNGGLTPRSKRMSTHTNWYFKDIDVECLSKEHLNDIAEPWDHLIEENDE